MARPLRIEFPGALYHLCSRGNARQAIYLDDGDRRKWLTLLGEVCIRFNWVCYSYCLMTNHYHLMIETPDGNLSLGMRHLNGVYSQYFNKRHRRVGHLYQGRYSSPLVEKEAYLQELCRYIVLNPVRARMVRTAQEWRWSSHQETLGLRDPPDWLQVDWLLSCFAKSRQAAIEHYKIFLSEGSGQPSPLENLKNQIYLGSDEFVAKVQCWLVDDSSLDEIPSAQKRPVEKSLSFYKERNTDRNIAMAKAYLSGTYSMAEIGVFFGVHYMTVSRAISKFELKNV
jgi:putative transposase